MTVVALVVGAAIVLTLMVWHAYSPEGAHTVRVGKRARAPGGSDAGSVFSSDGSDGGCSAGDAGGSCGGDGGN